MNRIFVDPRPHSQSVWSWLLANRDGVILGAIVAAVIVAVMLVARLIGQHMVDGESASERMGWRTVIGRVLARTSIAFMFMAAIDIVATYAAPPERGQHLVDVGFIIAFALQSAIWARELVLAMIARRVGADPAESTLGNATAVIRVLVSVTLFALAIIVILDNLGINVTALVAGLGVGGIAIGLAAQGIFSDLFAALSILLDRPFRRGDTIRYDDSTGTVERIGLKSTRLRSLTGEQLIMANTKLLEREIHNLAAGRTRRATLSFGLIYQTPPDKLERIADLARVAVEARKGCKFVRCAMIGFGASSLDHELLYDCATLNPDLLAAHRAAIMLAILRAFAAEGIQFAFPTQTSFTAAPDGSFVLPYFEPR